MITTVQCSICSQLNNTVYHEILASELISFQELISIFSVFKLANSIIIINVCIH